MDKAQSDLLGASEQEVKIIEEVNTVAMVIVYYSSVITRPELNSMLSTLA